MDKISVYIILFHDLQFLDDILNLINDYVDEIIIIDGPYKYACDTLKQVDLFYDTTNLPEQLQFIIGKYNKIKYEYKIFDTEENLNLFIKKEIIFNIEPCKRFRFLHFIPILGTIIRFVILIFIKYKRGFSIITSKSGENIIYLKKQNYEKFSKLILQYI